jgi:DNA processing protein
MQQGSLLSYYMIGVAPDRQNFTSRNRILSGISYATIVIESSKKGGSLITADIANHYNRDLLYLVSQ